MWTLHIYLNVICIRTAFLLLLISWRDKNVVLSVHARVSLYNLIIIMRITEHNNCIQPCHAWSNLYISCRPYVGYFFYNKFWILNLGLEPESSENKQGQQFPGKFSKLEVQNYHTALQMFRRHFGEKNREEKSKKNCIILLEKRLYIGFLSVGTGHTVSLHRKTSLNFGIKLRFFFPIKLNHLNTIIV